MARTNRTLSSSSTWHVDSDVRDGPRDQRRLRHLSSVQIRNLTLNPRRDQLSTLLGSSAPGAGPTAASPASTGSGARGSRLQFASDDTDLYLRNRRRRATSNASHLAQAGNRLVDVWGGDAGADGAGASGSMRRSSSSGANAALDGGSGIKEEADGPASPSTDEPGDSIAFPSEPHSHEADVSSAFGASHPASIAPSARRRSTSRASLASVGTGGSGSTIRAAPPRTQSDTLSLASVAPKLPTEDPNKAGRVSYTSEAQLAKEKERRVETLRRRLFSTFISLSLVPRSADVDKVAGRRRGGSGSSTSRVKLSRSTSSGAPHRARNRTLSTPTTPSPSASTAQERPPPFFISQPQHKTTHPTFPIDRTDFLVERPEHWTGLAEPRVLVSVWTRSPDTADQSSKGKEKGVDPDWKLLVEWDVDFDGLISLGRDSTTFPALPPNSLVFTLDDEYFTAPLPSSPRRPYGSDSDSSASDDGNLSDPGTIELVARRRRRDVEEEQRRKRRVLVEKSVRETRMVKPASSEALVKLLELEQSLDQTQAELAVWNRQVDAALEEPDGVLTSQREIVERENSVSDLEKVKASLSADLIDTTSKLEARREALRARRGRLKAARELNDLSRSLLADSHVSLAEDESIGRSVRQEAHSRRTQLITLLSHIFPIDPAPEADAPSSLLFTILALPLPNSSFPGSLSDDTLSSALGYTAQVVSTLSAYLAVPLHYPIQCLGSRSTVVDLISVMRGPRAFPLFGKGVDRYRFDYGVFLLNKNIEQLMYSQGLTVIDLRNTLPNLKSLILSLSYDPSHADFSSATLSPSSQFDVARPLTPLPSLTDDILDNFSSSLRRKASSGASGPRSEPEQAEATDSDSDSDDEPPIPRSPSTIKATSVRSLSPVPTLNGKLLGNGSGRANGSGGEAMEKAARRKGSIPGAGAWSVG